VWVAIVQCSGSSPDLLPAPVVLLDQHVRAFHLFRRDREMSPTDSMIGRVSCRICGLCASIVDRAWTFFSTNRAP